MEDKLILIIQNALRKASFDDQIKIVLTKPKQHGDYSTNIAMQLASKHNQKPQAIANQLLSHLQSDLLDNVVVAGPGFINFFLSNKAYTTIIKDVLVKGAKYGQGHQNKYINVEYVSANPTGYLHLGHARGAAIGSSLVNILRFAGNRVDTDYYINDAGNQINLLGLSVFIRYQNVLGNDDLRLPEDSYKGADIIECAKFLVTRFGLRYKDQKYEDVSVIFQNAAKNYMLKEIKKHLAQYRTHIELYVSETSICKSGEISRTLKRISANTYRKDNALWLNTTKAGDDKDRVLIKSDQSFTYFLPDLTYHNNKIERGYDELINIWGSDHIGYIKRMEIGIGYLGLNSDKVDTLVVQSVKLFKNGKELKMSKRKGSTFTLDEIMEMAGVDAARWFMVDRACNSEIIFDVDKARSKTRENPIFTIQYTHARINQLISKATASLEPLLYNEAVEIAIITRIKDFPSVIEDVATNHRIHFLAKYVSDLCKSFNSWYSTTRALGSARESSLIALAKATQIVIKTTLGLFGINAPEQM